MDTTPTTPQQQSSALPSRDHSVHRRAYLDTYAKIRAGKSTDVAEVKTEQTLPTQIVEQQPQVAEAASSPLVSSVLDDDVVIESQPPVVGDMFVSNSLIQDFQPQANLRQPNEGTKPTSYLDTLTKRHADAVAAAPDAEETVIVPSWNFDSLNLLEETEGLQSENSIEANLRALYGDYSLTNQLAKSTSSASASHVRTIVASSLACGILAMGLFGLFGRYSSQPVVAQPIDSPVIEVDAPNVTGSTKGTSKATLGNLPQNDLSNPTRLLIGGIGVNAPVQSLGTTADGLIDVPQSYGVVGWYNKGATPGKPGPAILVGHYTGGNGGVFDKLKDLKAGDLITVTNGKGETFTYKVSAQNEYEKDQVPMAELFKPNADSKLQIITCSGKWQSKNYNKRLVVTAEIVK